MERLFKHLKHALHELNSNEYMQSRGLELEERGMVVHLKAIFIKEYFNPI